MAEKEGFEPSRPLARPTPLAGEPLQPLEYFSIFFGGEGGIRTHVGLHPNGFQDRPVMTASVPLLVFNLLVTHPRLERGTP